MAKWDFLVLRSGFLVIFMFIYTYSTYCLPTLPSLYKHVPSSVAPTWSLSVMASPSNCYHLTSFCFNLQQPPSASASSFNLQLYPSATSFSFRFSFRLTQAQWKPKLDWHCIKSGKHFRLDVLITDKQICIKDISSYPMSLKNNIQLIMSKDMNR